MTHTPDVSSDITTGINEESTTVEQSHLQTTQKIQLVAIRQYGIRYIWTFGDGDTETVNVGSNPRW